MIWEWKQMCSASTTTNSLAKEFSEILIFEYFGNQECEDMNQSMKYSER